MRILLKLKHWQIFMLTWGIALIINIFTISDPNLMLKTFPIVMVFFFIGTYGWIWAIATNLHDKLPHTVQLNLRTFKILFSIPLIYISLLILYFFLMFYVKTNLEPGPWIGLIVLLHIASLVIAIWGIRFAAKTFKSVELQRTAKFGDYAGEFFLIWFSIIGYWILQPRLNRLITTTEERHSG